MRDSKNNKKEITFGFWNTLGPYPLILAPMADVTDIAFRRMIAKYSRMGKEGGGPDILYTEFVSADGICSEGREHIIHMLAYEKEKRPIVAQIFSKDPEKVYCAAKFCLELGFDGIDLNMGCPVENIVKQGAGSAMIKTPERAKEIIVAAKEGVAHKIPVSVKTRIGWDRDEVDTWIPHLLETDIAAIILHGRTRREMSKVPTHWDSIARATDIVHSSEKGTKIVGNGDVLSIEEAERYMDTYHVDAVMIGRAIFGKPWFFDRERILEPKSIEEKLSIMLEHTKLFRELLPHKNFNILKKHYKAYVNGFDGAKELRIKLMSARDEREVEKILDDFLSSR